MQKLKSRKLWVTILASTLVILGDQLFGLELDTDQLVVLGLAVITYVGSQGAVDKAKAKTEVLAETEKLVNEVAVLKQELRGKHTEPPANTELYQG